MSETHELAASGGVSAPVTSSGVEASPAPVSPAVAEMQSWDAAYDAATQKVSTPQEQAPVEAGSSTPAGSDDDSPAEAGAATSAEGDAPPVSTAEAPAHWPEETRKQFEALPDEARPMVLEFTKGMQAAFTRGMQGLKQREQELGQIVGLAEHYQKGPDAAREVLQRLADTAGLPIWFEQPAPAEADEAPPEFADAQELAKWARDQALKAVERTKREQERAYQAQLQDVQRREAFREQLTVALQRYPDLSNHRDTVMEHMEANPALSVEQAYHLATWQNLQKLAQEGDKARKELLALKKQQQQQRAEQTRPVNGQAGVSAGAVSTDPWEAAWNTAQRTLASRSN